MAKNNRKGIEFPPKFMKRMKEQKKRKIRNTPIEDIIVEKQHNNAAREL